MKRSIILAAAVSAIVVAAGCSGGGGAVQRQPGEWEMVTQVKSLELPGAPPEAQAQIRSQVGQSQTNRECLTAQEAANPLGQMRRMMSQGQAASCNFSDQTFAGGVIRIRATCPGPGGGPGGELALEGTYTATTMQASMTVSGGAGGPGGRGMRMSAEVRGRRVGDCPGGAQAGNTQ